MGLMLKHISTVSGTSDEENQAVARRLSADSDGLQSKSIVTSEEVHDNKAAN